MTENLGEFPSRPSPEPGPPPFAPLPPAGQSPNQTLWAAPIDVKVTTSPARLTKPDPPLFTFIVTNPVTYFKKWWKKVMGNEGVKITLQIKPLTAILLVTVFSGLGFGFGRLVLPEPIIRYLPGPTPLPLPTPTPNPWKSTAYTGKLQLSGGKFFLVTTSAQAITLEVPASLNLNPLVGKRILAVGEYHQGDKIMRVTDTTNLEVLPAKPSPVPTAKTSPTPTKNSNNTNSSPQPLKLLMYVLQDRLC